MRTFETETKTKCRLDERGCSLFIHGKPDGIATAQRLVEECLTRAKGRKPVREVNLRQTVGLMKALVLEYRIKLGTTA